MYYNWTYPKCYLDPEFVNKSRLTRSLSTIRYFTKNKKEI